MCCRPDINYRANIDVLKRAGYRSGFAFGLRSSRGIAARNLRAGRSPGPHLQREFFFGKWPMSRWRIRFRRGCMCMAAAAKAEGIAAVQGGTYVCMEGPQFSSLAESLSYKAQGYSVIGMTNMPEAKLAREAEICYASVAMVTDFDCWHPDHDAVTVQDIIRVLNSNAGKAKALVAHLARDFPREHEPCPIGSDKALDTALITAPEARDPKLLAKLDAVAGRVLSS
jgi:5'-methylthioadenosine phosphorylase